MFAKLENGTLIVAPDKLKALNTTVWNPTEQMYLDNGYSPVEFTDIPEEAPDGYYYESGWEQTNTTIVQTWTLTPLPDDIDDATAFGIIFGGAE